MDKKYSIKDKLNGKWFTYGNVTPGEKGPRMGLKVTPELKKLIADAEEGKWQNFLLFEDNGPKKQFAGDDTKDSGIPF